MKFIAIVSLVVPSFLLPTKFLFRRLQYLRAEPRTCNHSWEVVASIISTVELQVQCKKCLIYSEVSAPTEQEWADSYGAMENPYPWDDVSRISYYKLSEEEREKIHMQSFDPQ